eukprot:CAMPEP_0194272276 /NCGR_PEP_ID=MMETSP0169-20130528/5884_1 /TAXON_ID=218684 /ORGANISM="Corethron pennatum, Strain L29A3" /LENGTH=330 /DNA_ID=CAMNT_0039014893 /DNA_START=169 /DNA_END=1158 /DNA_ORIENTATION=-
MGKSDRSTVSTVSILNKALRKSLDNGDSDKDDESEVLDIFERLSGLPINVAILLETKIGSTISKFKSHESEKIPKQAKALVRKWKDIAKREGVSNKPEIKRGVSNKSEIKRGVPRQNSSPGSHPPPRGGSSSTAPPKKTVVSPAQRSASEHVPDAWNDLPPLRRSVRVKLLEILLQAPAGDVAQYRTVAAAVESALDRLRLDRAAMASKSRQLVFNLRKNGTLRGHLLDGSVTPEGLLRMSSEELQTEERVAEKKRAIDKQHDSRRLDWDKANEDKINDMCGIKGDLLNASLFTCNRCKSTKTTSTQKQTRSADEPMTVFVLCENCGKRW